LYKTIKLYGILVSTLICGLICTVSVNNSEETEDVPPASEMVSVYAAAIDMDPGEPFDLTKIKVVEIAVEQLQDEKPIADLSLIKDQYAACRLLAGAPITAGVLSATDKTPGTTAAEEAEPVASIAATKDLTEPDTVEQPKTHPKVIHIEDIPTDPPVEPLANSVAVAETTDPVVPVVADAVSPAQQESYWKMEVVTPQGITYYEWTKKTSNPTIMIADEKDAIKTSNLSPEDERP